MGCGIHQGGYISLLNYIAFIDPLLRILEYEGMRCHVAGIPTNPVGYADVMASASTSKSVVDKTLRTVHNYTNKWRYAYNATKSAVFVFEENPRERTKGAKYKNFSLGGEKVPEKDAYINLGVKNCLYNNYMPRTEERISKGSRAFHALTSIGIKKKGVNMSVCSKLFTCGSEIWVMKSDKITQIPALYCEAGDVSASKRDPQITVLIMHHLAGSVSSDTYKSKS